MAILLAVVVGSASCTVLNLDDADPARNAAPTGAAAAVDALTAAGAGVYDGPADARPVKKPRHPGPLRLLRSQVANLARDADAGGGIDAGRIDALLPMPKGSVPISFLLAGYVAAGRTQGAKYARTLMAGQNLNQPRTLLFPTLVLALFTADVTANAAKRPPAGPSGAGAVGTAGTGTGDAGIAAIEAGGAVTRVRLAAASPCGDLSAFFRNTLQAVAGAIVGVLPDIPFLKPIIAWALTKGLQYGLDGAAAVIERIPFIQALRSAVGGLALAVTVVAALRDWTVSVTAEPPRAHYATGAGFSGAKAIATVNDGPGDVFSPEVRQCASALGITLAKGGAPGSAATWDVVAGKQHATPVGTRNAAVGDDKRTTLALTMSRESDDAHRHGRIANGLVVLRVTVKRQDVQQVRRFVEQAITGALPAPVYAALTATLGDPLGKIAAMTDVTGQGRLVAEYHLAATPTPSSVPSGEPTRGRAVRVSLDRPAASTIRGGRIVDFVSCDGPYGTWKGKFRVGAYHSLVPWYDIPATFTVGGSGTRKLTVPLKVVTIKVGLGPGVRTDPSVDVTVTAKSMTFSQLPDGDPAPFTLPIKPAPGAACP
ncbi:hypothetical protein AAH991_13355 [Microbispora sp. ZYX-F-249]|uniref:Uncharacterized protein n=1 Tax=Microbispora maris TaxID=3144104 RepID=A0ABV0APB5_9ACTN